MEITLIAISEERRKTVQEPWFGKGNVRLNSVSNSVSVLQCHAASDPNDREGISVRELLTPAICIGVSGDAFASCKRNASARTSCIAIDECFAASR